MKKNIFPSVCIFSILFLVRGASAQDTIQNKFGIAFGIADNIHSADFTALPGIPGCCTNFTSGSGNGLVLNLLYERAVSDFLVVGARLGFMDHSATLTAASQKGFFIVNGETKSGDYTRSIDLVASSFGIEVHAGIPIIKGLIVSAGIRIGFLLSAKFIQRETAASGTFQDSTGKDTRSNIRNQYAGALPNASSVIMHGIFSLSYEFPLNRKHTTFIVPEISHTPALNDIVKGLNWKTNAVIFDIALKFSID